MVPIFVIWFAWAIYPMIYSKDVLGGAKDFADCAVVRYDEVSGSMVPTNETIEVAQVDHEIKLV